MIIDKGSIERFTVHLVGAIMIFALIAGADVRAQSQPPSEEELEMRRIEVRGTERGAAAPAAVAQFKQEYSAEAPRPVFEKYIPILGAAALLDFLEETYPACHAQSHELGKALFATSGDLGTALRECGTRCTSGCMHGAVGEAFGNSTLEAISSKMNTFCYEGEMARIHKPGNCAHGLGHALMFVNSGDVKKSVDGCLGFENESMQYYCATGVFMEKIVTGAKSATPAHSLHSPCDEETLFPSACYRYKTVDLLRQLRDPVLVTEECLRLNGSQQFGCFHGLGNAFSTALFKDPAKLPIVCAKGGRDNQIACIEGGIEKLADYDEARAKTACASLDDGELRKVCVNSAVGKMYNLTKPTFPLYYDKEAVAKRKAALGVAPKAAEDRSHHQHTH